MIISNNISLDSNERILAAIEEAKEPFNLEIDISKIHDTSFAAFPTFVQAFSTWLRHGKAKLIINNDIPETIQDKRQLLLIDDSAFFFFKYLFATTSLFWKYDVTFQSLSFKDIVRKHNTYFQENAKNVKCFRGSELLLASFDFDRVFENRGLLSALYTTNGELRSEEYFIYNLVPKVLTEMATRFSPSYYQKTFSDTDVFNIGKILYELYKNTHEWGRHEFDKTKLISPNIRAIYLQMHQGSIENLIEKSRTSAPLMEYYSEIKSRLLSNKLLYFLEISVFDSGPGFVQRFLGDSENTPTIAEQVHIIQKCLTKYFTSSTNLFSENKGKGLDSVLKSLDNRGFLKIRTGNSNLYRNLVKDNYGAIKNPNEIKLFDWNTGTNSNFTRCSKTVGSVISLMYPINLEK